VTKRKETPLPQADAAYPRVLHEYPIKPLSEGPRGLLADRAPPLMISQCHLGLCFQRQPQQTTVYYCIAARNICCHFCNRLITFEAHVKVMMITRVVMSISTKVSIRMSIKVRVKIRMKVDMNMGMKIEMNLG
jgi:hypothetical protein